MPPSPAAVRAMFRAFLRTGRPNVLLGVRTEIEKEAAVKREREKTTRASLRIEFQPRRRADALEKGLSSPKKKNALPSLSQHPPSGADFPNYNIREYIRRRARERFREAASEATTAAAAGRGQGASSPAASSASSASSPADLAFAAGQRELEAARRQAELARLYHRPQRSVMDVMSTAEHLEREAGRGA